MVSNVHPKKPDSARVDELNKVRGLSATWTTIYPRGLIVIIVGLGNRTAERRGRQNACVWQLDMVITCAFCCVLYFPLMLSGLLQIRSVKKRVKIGGKFFKTKCYCHACHTRFVVFFLSHSVSQFHEYISRVSINSKILGSPCLFYTFFWCGISYEC